MLVDTQQRRGSRTLTKEGVKGASKAGNPVQSLWRNMQPRWFWDFTAQ